MNLNTIALIAGSMAALSADRWYTNRRGVPSFGYHSKNCGKHGSFTTKAQQRTGDTREANKRRRQAIQKQRALARCR